MSGDDSPGEVVIFEQARPRLRGLAYRILGSLDDAEDVVQDAWLRWRATDISQLSTPEAWLTTVTTRLALDHVRANRIRRADYPGPWLPEPLVSMSGPQEVAELADSLTLGFLTLLDQLGPVERAVFVLADVFGVPYVEIAATMGKSDTACRQIATRARRRLREATPRQSSAGADRRVLDKLMTSIALGDIEQVVAGLAPGVVCVTDGGPERRAARRPIVGATRVARFLINLAKRYGDATMEAVTVNGDDGFVVKLGGVVDFVAAFECQGDHVTTIRMIRNPAKLSHISELIELQ